MLSTVVSRTVMSLRFYAMNNSACHGFVDADKRHETLRSETKDFAAHIITSNISVMFMFAPFAPPPKLTEAMHSGLNEFSTCNRTLSLGNFNLLKGP